MLMIPVMIILMVARIIIIMITSVMIMRVNTYSCSHESKSCVQSGFAKKKIVKCEQINQ